MKRLGTVLLLLSVGYLTFRVLIPEFVIFEDIFPQASYLGSLVGGFLVGFGAKRDKILGQGQHVLAGQQSAEGIYCPNPSCGAQVTPGQQFCTTCGTRLGKSAFREIRCSNPVCGAVVAPGHLFCTQCGWATEDQGVANASASGGILRCPNRRCGQIVKPEQKFCTTCGTLLTETSTNHVRH